jgi:hypothetical protein
MVGNDITIRGVKDAGGNNSTNISLFGGDAASDARAGGGAIASSDAFMVAKNTKSIDIGGTLLLRGGKTALTGQSTAVAKLDPSVLTISTGGDIILIGGEGPNSSASIVNNGDIQLVIGGNGYRTITYSALKDLSTFETKTVTVPGGLIIIGGPGSGLFGARSTQIELGDQIKAAFTRGGGYTLSIDTGLPSAFIEANSLRAFDSLLGYIIFAANEETRAARIRAGLGASDDSNMPACN